MNSLENQSKVLLNEIFIFFSSISFLFIEILHEYESKTHELERTIIDLNKRLTIYESNARV